MVRSFSKCLICVTCYARDGTDGYFPAFPLVSVTENRKQTDCLQGGKLKLITLTIRVEIFVAATLIRLAIGQRITWQDVCYHLLSYRSSQLFNKEQQIQG